MWAAQRGNYSVLKAMLEKGVAVHACDKLGATGEHTVGQRSAHYLNFTTEPPMWGSPIIQGHVILPPSPALHAAALSGHANCVQLLIQHGASVDVVDNNGHSPLFRACERGHTEVVVLLLHAGATVGLVDSSGRSCLHWAASGGHTVICSSLLHQGLAVDCLDSGGLVEMGGCKSYIACHTAPCPPAPQTHCPSLCSLRRVHRVPDGAARGRG